MPDTTTPDKRALLWKELQASLASVNHAEFEMLRGDHDAARMWLADTRRSLGAAALLLADEPDAAAYSRLLNAVLTEPNMERVKRGGQLNVPTTE